MLYLDLHGWFSAQSLFPRGARSTHKLKPKHPALKSPTKGFVCLFVCFFNKVQIANSKEPGWPCHGCAGSLETLWISRRSDGRPTARHGAAGELVLTGGGHSSYWLYLMLQKSLCLIDKTCFHVWDVRLVISSLFYILCSSALQLLFVVVFFVRLLLLKVSENPLHNNAEQKWNVTKSYDLDYVIKLLSWILKKDCLPFWFGYISVNNQYCLSSQQNSKCSLSQRRVFPERSYLLQHRDRKCRSNWLSHPITVYCHRVKQS